MAGQGVVEGSVLRAICPGHKNLGTPLGYTIDEKQGEDIVRFVLGCAAEFDNPRILFICSSGENCATLGQHMPDSVHVDPSISSVEQVVRMELFVQGSKNIALTVDAESAIDSNANIFVLASRSIEAGFAQELIDQMERKHPGQQVLVIDFVGDSAAAELPSIGRRKQAQVPAPPNAPPPRPHAQPESRAIPEEPKRKRGRPRKASSIEKLPPQQPEPTAPAASSKTPKRKLGRPRKTAAPEKAQAESAATSVQSTPPVGHSFAGQLELYIEEIIRSKVKTILKEALREIAEKL